MNPQIDKWQILKNTTMIMQSNTVSVFVHLLYLSKFSSDGSCCIYGIRINIFHYTYPLETHFVANDILTHQR